MRRHAATLLLLLPIACAPQTPPPTLPGGPSGTPSAQYLTVGEQIGHFYANPQPNQPAAAARAIADLEWMADALPRNPRWAVGASSVAMNGLASSRWEARRALGIPQGAAGQAVISGLIAAAAAIEANDQAALARALPRRVFTLGPARTVAKLSEPPRLPDLLPALSGLSAGPTQGMVH